MKILFVAHNFVRGNGQGRINYEVVRYALRQGHQVHLAADRVAPELLKLGAELTPVHQKPHRPNLLGVRTFAHVANRVTARLADKMDIIVGAGFTLRYPHDVNLCQFVHGAWIKSPVHTSRFHRGPYGWYQSLYSRFNAAWERHAYGHAGIVVAPSDKIRNELRGIGVPTDRIRVIYNGVDLQEFSPGNVSRADLGLPENVPLALFVGDIRTPRKNLDSILKAMVDVPALHLAIVGAIERSPFPQMAQSLNIADRTHFMGFRSDVGQIMRACDLFVFPSRYEAGTLVLLEAAASGLPIVTARTAGGCEVLDSAAAEILQDPDDLPMLIGALRRMISSPERRRTAAAAARAVAERYSWDDMARQYLDLFAGARGISRGETPQPIGLLEDAYPEAVAR